MDIVILHGWNLSAKNYSKLIEHLTCKGYRVFCPDFPGFGSEPKPQKPYDLDDYVDFLKDYVAAKKLKRFIIIGHSFGGRVGLRFAEKYPKQVEKLILAGVPAIPISSVKVNFYLIMTKLGKFILSSPILSFISPIAKKIIYIIAGVHDYEKAEGVMQETFKKVIKFNLVPTMKNIKVPTQIVWGEKDIVTPVRIGYKMKGIIPNAKLFIAKNEGHGFVHRNPDFFVKYANL